MCNTDLYYYYKRKAVITVTKADALNKSWKHS